MTTLEHVLAQHIRLTKKAYDIVETKGRDYNRRQQKEGDTLFNMTVAKTLGITDTVTQGILVRLSDKFMRLSSLCRDPSANAAVKDESVEDTITDAINYLVYLNCKYQEERKGMKTSGYNAGRKKATVGADRPKLDYITNWLKVNSTGIHVSKSNYYVESPVFKTKTRDTDLFLNNNVHLQHDTVTCHCELGYERLEDDERHDKDKKRKKTAIRNSEYYKLWMSTGEPFVVLNQQLAAMLGLNEGALTAYLYYHARMLENARVEAMVH